MKVGDLIWQSRLPGGVCIYLGDTWDPDMNETLYKVLHPTEGYLEDPTYYFMTLEERYDAAVRQEKWRQKNADQNR